jgi:hypothetical protein
MLNGQITTNDAGEKFIFALVSGHTEPLVAHQSHPNFKRIAQQFLDQDENGFAELFDIPKAVEASFARLSERVTTKAGRIYFDGDEVHGTLVDTILRFLDEGEDFAPLVKFFENIAANPNDHSREQLYDWLVGQQKHDGGVTIDEDGYLVAYKGVGRDGDGSLRSVSSGKAIVDGVEVQGRIPNEVGSTVEMPRSEVVHDPGNACSRGLHVGTFDYAQGWASGALLRVSVNPRDVVSVPTDAGGQKVRVCRYIIEDVITEPVSSALLRRAADDAPETLDADVDVDVSLDDSPLPYKVGDVVEDLDGDRAIIKSIEALGDGEYEVTMTYTDVKRLSMRNFWQGKDFKWVEAADDVDEDWITVVTPATPSQRPRTDGRIHGKGGATAAHGTGRHPAQDAKGRFSGGRPGSKRDEHGRFIG